MPTSWTLENVSGGFDYPDLPPNMRVRPLKAVSGSSGCYKHGGDFSKD